MQIKLGGRPLRSPPAALRPGKIPWPRRRAAIPAGYVSSRQVR